MIILILYFTAYMVYSEELTVETDTEVEAIKVDSSSPAAISTQVLEKLKEQAEKLLVDAVKVENEENRNRWIQINPDTTEASKDTSLLFQMHKIWSKFSNISCGEEFVAKATCVSAMKQMNDFIAQENQIGSDYADYLGDHTKEDFKDRFCSLIEAGCKDNEFPSIDGWCNNLEHPEWGGTNIPYRRLRGKSYYKDGVSEAWSEADGFPSPREISQTFMNDPNVQTMNEKMSVLFMQWGQFLAHDITQGAARVVGLEGVRSECGKGKTNLYCTSMKGSNSEIENGDETFPFFSSVKVNKDRCGEFDNPIQSEQVNGHSSYIHATTVYSWKKEQTEILRKKTKNGCLDPFFPSDRNEHCGDGRCFVTPVLYSLHGLFLKEHNRLVDELKKTNLMPNSEMRFNVARRILIAEIQAITYQQWLPLVLGDEIMHEYDLDIPQDPSTKYDPEIDATLFNEFVTAGFRFGHSLIAGNINSNGPKSHKLNQTFFNFGDITKDSHYEYLKGGFNSPCEKSDKYVSSHMQKVPWVPVADLAAINIGRGRDHGTPPYYKVRTFFELESIRKDEFSGDNYQKLEELYKNLHFSNSKEKVENIDLWVGGVSEKHVEGGQVGPTFAHLIALQFSNLKFGDRFFFSHGYGYGKSKGIPSKILRESLRRRTLGDIICENTGGSVVRRNVFEFKSDEIDCGKRNKLDYVLIARSFRENKHEDEPSISKSHKKDIGSDPAKDIRSQRRELHKQEATGNRIEKVRDFLKYYDFINQILGPAGYNMSQNFFPFFGRIDGFR